MNSLNKIRPLIKNELDYPNEQPFAAILGESPSKGARSPKLWNAAFQAFEMPARMLPMDVSSARLPELLTALSDNQYFLGGAVAVPHKVAVAELLGDRLTAEARAIRAVNSLFRGSSGKLMGTNTDGEAARTSLVYAFGSIEGKTILVLGGGGAGKAVSAFMASGVGNSGTTLLACRENFPTADRQHALGIQRTLKWDEITSVLLNVDVVINCTTLGSIGKESDSPLSTAQIDLLSPSAVVYDIIYQPCPTQLLVSAEKKGLKILDGLRMNFEQAVIAFGYAVGQHLDTYNSEAVRVSMSTA